MKNVIVNAMPDDTYIAVKAQYPHTSVANLVRGGCYRSTAILEVPDGFPFDRIDHKFLADMEKRIDNQTESSNETGI